MCLFHIEVEKVFNFHIQLIVAQTMHTHHNTLPCHCFPAVPTHFPFNVWLIPIQRNTGGTLFVINTGGVFDWNINCRSVNVFGIRWSKHLPPSLTFKSLFCWEGANFTTAQCHLWYPSWILCSNLEGGCELCFKLR